jgi:hypothetical protein
MSSKIQTIAVTVALLGIVAGVSAQNAPSPAQKKAINEALQTVAENSQKACDGVDCVIAACQDAKKSGDAKQMRKALDLAEKELGESKEKSRKAIKIAQLVHDHMEKIDAQRAKVKQEQQSLDALEYPTDNFVIGY